MTSLLTLSTKTTLIASLVLFLSCERTLEPDLVEPFENIPLRLPELKMNDYDLTILDGEHHPYRPLAALKKESLPHNPDDSVRMGMLTYEGELHYHPVRMAFRMLGFWRSLQETGDPDFIVGIDHILNKLFEIGIWYEDAIFFPYSIDIYPHAGRGTANTTMLTSPWFSGMAQGQVLSVLSLMYQETNDSKYLEMAEPVFNSFFTQKSDFAPWVTYVDTAGYLWLEEYPFEEPSHVLNGFIYAMFGLYDYYACNPDDSIREYFLNATLTTIENQIIRYRREGTISFYCLLHDYASESYHHVHIDQLKALSRISNNDYFQEISLWMEDDFDVYSNSLGW